jgi:hypothetical protein
MMMMMMKLIDRILEKEDHRQRIDAVRMLVGLFATLYVLVRAPYLVGSSHDAASFAPVGICSFLHGPLSAPVMWTLVGAAVVSGGLFTLGRWLRITGPIWFVTLLFVTSYASSWGKILHSENLVVFHAGILALAFALRRRRGRGRVMDGDTARLALRALSLVTVLTYFVAGITKLRSGGAGWISGEALGDWLAWDALRKIELGSIHSPLAPLIASSRPLVQVLAVYTLIVELGAPLAMFSRRIAIAWVLLAWMFHLGILLTMAIGFFYPLSAIAFASMLPIERLPLLRRLVANNDEDEGPESDLRTSTPSLFH